MARVVLEITSQTHARRELQRFDATEIHIGRGYHNDVIAQDSYVSSSHAVLRLDEHGWRIEDLKSRNGIFVYAGHGRRRVKTRITQPFRLGSGDAFQIGMTTIRIFLPEHRISATKRLESRTRFVSSINNGVNAWYAILGFFILYYMHLLMHFSRVEISHGQMLFAEILMFLGMVLWAAIWALIGRLIRHKSKFRLQLTLTCFFAICLVPVVNIASMAGFVLGAPLVEAILILTGGGLAVTLLLMGHESVATFLPFKTRLIFSAMVPVVLCVLVVVGYIAYETEFRPDPQHYINLKPPLVRPFSVYSISEFVDAEVAYVFQKGNK